MADIYPPAKSDSTPSPKRSAPQPHYLTPRYQQALAAIHAAQRASSCPRGYTKAEILAAQLDAERLGYRSSRQIAKDRAAATGDGRTPSENPSPAPTATSAPGGRQEGAGALSARGEDGEPGEGRQGPS
jgi:hypothetical protein